MASPPVRATGLAVVPSPTWGPPPPLGIPAVEAGAGPRPADEAGARPRAAAPLEVVGRGGALRIWLGERGDAVLEADVRDASDGCATRPALAVALGDVARRHKLEVRIFPRVENAADVLFVVFGARKAGYRR